MDIIIYYGKDKIIPCSIRCFIQSIATFFIHSAQDDMIPSTDLSKARNLKENLYTNLFQIILNDLSDPIEKTPDKGFKYELYVSTPEHSWDKSYRKKNYWGRQLYFNLHKVSDQLHQMNQTPESLTRYLERYEESSILSKSPSIPVIKKDMKILL